MPGMSLTPLCVIMFTYTHSHIMYNVSPMYDALAERFDDMDEIKDVAEYGMASGFSGFIYSTELAEFFDKYEDEIEDELDAVGFKYSDLVDTDEFWTMQELKEKAVWCIVEMYCHQRVDAACAVA
jgi:hypothetical protein